jgi:hypothetical protein
MRARPGYSLVEMIIALSVGTLLVGGMYQALVIQERGYETTGAVVQDQETLRTTLAILEGELREVAAIGGSDIGGSDILYAGADSIRIRASRKLGVVCSVWPSDRAVVSWSEGDLFEAGDGVLVFVDGDPTTYTDDRWVAAEVINTASTANDCASSPSGVSHQRLQLDGHVLDGVLMGAPVRSFEEVSYRLRSRNGSWSLARIDSDSTIHHLVRGLAGPGDGLAFEYLNADGASTNDPGAIASVRVTLVTDPTERSGVEPTTISSTVYLRNN